MNFSEKIKYFYETVISENQIERIAEFISPECQIKTGETLIPSGIDGMKEHIRATKQTYPDYRIRIIRQFCDGDYIISEFIMEGTHQGEWQTSPVYGRQHRQNNRRFDCRAWRRSQHI